MKPQKSVCLKCQKDQHSEKLWDMHELAVEQGRYCSEHGKKENLYPITLWTAGRGIARVCRIKTSPPFKNDSPHLHVLCGMWPVSRQYRRGACRRPGPNVPRMLHGTNWATALLVLVSFPQLQKRCLQLLSDREKLVLHACCTLTIAKLTGVKNRNQIMSSMIEDIRRNRCRSIAPEDVEDLLEEINEEMTAGRILFQHLTEDIAWSMTGERPNRNTNWKDMR